MRTMLVPLPLALVLCLASPSFAQQASATPGATADEVRVYEAFRAWIGQQPPDVQRADDIYQRYGTELRRQGTSQEGIASAIDSLRRMGDRAEIERWNRILTTPGAPFNTAPNAFLVEMIKGMKPGRALDVGMGQGRNTIYLAQQGWDAVGFDPADRAVAAARDQAQKLGVKITTQVARAEDFDWGEGRWDLIVLSYVGAREFVANVQRALRPGGMVVVEAFHRDTTKSRPVGGAVVFDTNELPGLFSTMRVVRYEDADAIADFGLSNSRVVRLAAVKP